ncbi:MAG: nuclear transport factor 2 family protein [Desulfobacteraceae bacterium]|nr:nuclear transport factor 2 family protein [Desulfobacteraceae bacterium]
MDATAKGNRQWSRLTVVWAYALSCLPILVLSWSLPGSAADAAPSVRQTVSAWRQAWQEKDMERYAAFYSERFHASGQDRQVWLERKASTFALQGRIQIDMSDLRIAASEDRATVTFTQRYRGPRISDVGRKTLSLQRENGDWRIIGEDWSPVEAVSTEIEHAMPPKTEQASPATAQTRPRPAALSTLSPYSLALWTGERSEHVCVRLDRPFEPRLTPEDPHASRIQIEIPNVSKWIGPDQVFDGRWVRQVTAGVDPSTGVLRIAVEMEPGSECAASPAYIPSEHTFCLDFVLPGADSGANAAQE